MSLGVGRAKRDRHITSSDGRIGCKLEGSRDNRSGDISRDRNRVAVLDRSSNTDDVQLRADHVDSACSWKRQVDHVVVDDRRVECKIRSCDSSLGCNGHISIAVGLGDVDRHVSGLSRPIGVVFEDHSDSTVSNAEGLAVGDSAGSGAQGWNEQADGRIGLLDRRCRFGIDGRTDRSSDENVSIAR